MSQRVTVAYDGGINPDLDRTLRRIAGFQGGREVGSGCMLIGPCTRDIEFEFDIAHGAECFVRNVRAQEHFNAALDKVRVL